VAVLPVPGAQNGTLDQNDFTAGQCEPALPREYHPLYVDRYRLNLNQTELLSFTMRAGKFRPALFLLDPVGRVQASEIGAAGEAVIGPRLVTPGSRLLTTGGEGDYALEVRRCLAGTLIEGQLLEDKVSADDCPLWSDRTLVSKLYRLDVKEAGVRLVRLEPIEPEGFRPFVQMENWLQNVIARSELASVGKTTLLRADLGAGSYYVGVIAPRSTPGTYRLRVETVPLRVLCGALAFPSDFGTAARVELGPGCAQRKITVKLAGYGESEIHAVSDTLQPLLKPTRRPTEGCPDRVRCESEGRGHAWCRWSGGAGTYEFTLLTDEKEPIGTIDLSTAFKKQQCPTSELKIGVPVSGRFCAGDSKVSDCLGAQGDQLRDSSYIHMYSLTVTPADVAYGPLEFSRPVLLLDHNGRAVAGGIGSPGQYWAAVLSAEEGATYKLSAKRACFIERNTTVGQVKPFERNAALGPEDCLDEQGNYAKLYRFKIDGSYTMQARMNATGFSPKLTLVGQPSCAETREPGGRESLLGCVLPPGEHTLMASSVSAGAGNYRLSVETFPVRLELPTVKGQVVGELRASDSAGPAGVPTHQFLIRLERPRNLLIRVLSNDFVPEVNVLDGGLRPVLVRSRGVESSVTLPAGVYLIRVSPVAPSVGRYILQWEQQ